MKQKIKDVLMWIGCGIAVILLLALCSTLEYVKSLEEFKIEAPGISDVCSIVEATSCGLSIKDCRSKKEYKCVVNVSVEPIK